MRECVIYGNHTDTWQAFYAQLASQLELPEWFGQNLDALYDCLTELREAQITIYQWDTLAQKLGEKTKNLRRVLTDAGIANPGLIVCILEEADDEI